MMTEKAKLIILFILIITLTLSGCFDQEEETSFVASVLEVNQSSLLVEPSEGSAELSSADRIIAHIGEAIIEDPEGNEVDITSVEVGDRVVIFYDGTVAESYPAQVWPFRVQLTDLDDKIKEVFNHEMSFKD